MQDLAGAVRPTAEPDPVAAVLGAHAAGVPIVLTTSGTTSGRPRGIVRTTDSWWRSFEAYSRLTGVEQGARVWVPGPLSATMNLFASVHARAVGAEVVESAASATHACLTPSQLECYGERVADLRVCVAGDALGAGRAAPHLVHYYGAAELSFVAAGPHTGDLRCFPGVEVQVRDGEIWVRSPYLAERYDPPGAGALRRDDDGFATVGDRGRLVDGRLEVLGRPDFITTGGATVSVAEIEAALRPHARSAYAVHASPHATLGAVVTLTAVDADDLASLRAAARDLPAAMRPRRYVLREELPLTPAGKIDRAALRDSRHA